VRYGLLALTLYCIWCTSLYFAQDRLIFAGAFMAGVRDDVPRPPPGVERVQLDLPGDDGATIRSGAWYALGDGRTPRRPGPAVVFFHGNGETIESGQQLINEYTLRGYSVLLPEYRGFGGVKGTPGQTALVADGVAWVDWLRARPEVEAVIYHGRSLGGGVAAQVARERPPAALITESTFTSIASFATGYGVPPLLVRHPFRTDRAIAGFTFPILIMHGEQDTFVPVAHARKLATIQTRATLAILEGDHNNFPVDFVAYRAAIDTFLEGAGLLTPIEPMDVSSDAPPPDETIKARNGAS
jgi:fermentation-respiration switch protein FrsA (DUF1100 family)